MLIFYNDLDVPDLDQDSSTRVKADWEAGLDEGRGTGEGAIRHGKAGAASKFTPKLETAIVS